MKKFLILFSCLIVIFLIISCTDTSKEDKSKNNDDIPGTWSNSVKKTATDAEDGDLFGFSVSIDSNYAIVGAPNEDGSASGSNIGAAYIFVKSGDNQWTQEYKFTPPNPENEDNFGTSVGIHGNYAIIGAPGKNVGAEDSGAAYIYRRTGIPGTNLWVLSGVISASDFESNDKFGTSVSLYGNFVLIGAPYKNAGGISRGAAYYYRQTSTDLWGDELKVVVNGTGSSNNFDYFGYSVSIQGVYAVIGSPHHWTEGPKPSGYPNANGAAYIFEQPGAGNSWTNQYKITAADFADNDAFGKSVAIDNNTVVIGAYLKDLNGTNKKTGACYIFNRTGNPTTNTWSTGEKITLSDATANDGFGNTVSIKGNKIIIGTHAKHHNNKVYIYQGSGTSVLHSWSLMKKLSSNNTTFNDCYGYSVDITDNHAIVGAWNDSLTTTPSNNLSGSSYIIKQ